PLNMQHDAVRLHRHRVRLRGERPRRLHGDLIGADASAVRLADRAAGGEVELPAVPRAAQNLAITRPHVLARGGRQGHPLDTAQAERTALVRTTISQGVERAVDVEDADGAAVDINDLPLAGRQIGDCADDVAGHHSTSNSSATWQWKPGSK